MLAKKNTQTLKAKKIAKWKKESKTDIMSKGPKEPTSLGWWTSICFQNSISSSFIIIYMFIGVAIVCKKKRQNTSQWLDLLFIILLPIQKSLKINPNTLNTKHITQSLLSRYYYAKTLNLTAARGCHYHHFPSCGCQLTILAKVLKNIIKNYY